MMSKTLEDLLPLFWNDLAYLNAWQMSFDDARQRRDLLPRILQHLPTERGRVEFVHDIPGCPRFLVLFTYELTNNISWQNQAWILSMLAETGAITNLAVEGAFGQFDFSPFRANSNGVITRDVAVSFLKQSQMGPPSFVGITSTNSITAFGIDDKNLHKVASKHVLSKSPKYFDAIMRRSPIMLDNTLGKMDELGLDIVAVCLTDFNYDEFHSMLVTKSISHAGIRPTIAGDSVSFEEFWKETTRVTPLDRMFMGQGQGLLSRGWNWLKGFWGR